MAEDDPTDDGLTGAVLRDQQRGWYVSPGGLGAPRYNLAWLLSGLIVKTIRAVSARLRRLRS